MTESTPTDSASPEQQLHDGQIAALAEVFGEEFADDFRDPVLFMSETLRSPAPLSFYRRDFRLLSRYLFLESVYRRRPEFNQDVLDGFARMIGQKLTDVQTLLTKRIDQTDAILKSNGAGVNASYLQSRTFNIPIIAAHARSFITLLVKLDRLYQLIGSAALYGLMDSSQRAKAELEGRKAIRAFTAMIRNEHIKLRKESQRMRLARSGPMEPEVDRAEALVNQGQAEFDNSSEDEHDQAHVNPEDAQGVLEAIVTSGVAAANAATKRRGAKTTSDVGAPVEQSLTTASN